MDLIEITPALSIPRRELKFETARSGGPGGQNVNKVETKVSLVFDVLHSPSLSDSQRQRLLQKLASRLTREGLLRVSAQTHRSQSANRIEAQNRFARILRQALARRRQRHKTRVPQAEKKKRLEQKRRHSLRKVGRRSPGSND